MTAVEVPPPTASVARQRVRTALAHKEPERVPFSWQFCATPEMGALLAAWFANQGLSWKHLRQATDDMCTLNLPYTGSADNRGPWDMWGIEWKEVDYGQGTYREVARYPLAGVDSLQALDDYPWPRAEHCDYDALAMQAKAGSDRAARFLGFNPFETLCWMWGLEEVLCHCAVQPEPIVCGLEHITAYYEERLRRALARIGTQVDIVFFFDDLGGQHGPLLSPGMYRDLIQPFHRRLFSAAHELAPQAAVMMHSDGSVFDLLPDLIDAGLDVLEAVQVECAHMEPERLKDTFGTTLAFHGAISVQQLLPQGTPDAVAAECRRLVEILGAGGGYIAAPSHAMQVGTPPENVVAMLEAVLGREDVDAAWEAAREGYASS